MVKWPDLTFSPINLWNIWSINMGSGADGMYEDYRIPHKDVTLETMQKNAPYSSHYQVKKPEPIEVIENWGLSFHLGNAVKYIARCEYKGSKKQDLEKAIWYLERELARC